MRIAKITGFFGSILTIIGAIMKVMHYPGPSIIIPIGAILLLICVSAWFFSSFRDAKTGFDKFLYVVLFFSLIVQIVASLFKIMHYPGAGLPWNQIQVSLLLVLILSSIILYSRSVADQSRNGMVMFFVVYFSLSGYFLVKGGLPGHILEGFSYPDQAIIRAAENVRKGNLALYAKLNTDETKRATINELQQKSDELVSYITGLKQLVLTRANEEADAKVTADDEIYWMHYRQNYDIPSAVLLGEDGTQTVPGQSASDLKGKIEAYRTWISSAFGAPHLKELVGLSTDDCKIHDSGVQKWEECNFLHKPVASVAMVFDQLRLEVRNAESLALQSLLVN